MDIYEIRKKNLVSLIGSRRKGACAQRWEMAPAHLSQILSDRTEKNLGDDVARRIESIENLPHGWMDRLHDRADAEQASSSTENPKEAAAAAVMAMLQKHKKGLSAEAQQKIADAVADSLAEPEPSASPKSNVITGDFSRAAKVADGDILIPQYDVRAAMGNGQVPADYVEFVRNIIVSGPQLEKMGLDYTSIANLSIITGWGQSMEGTINDKDPVVVDRGVNEFVGDGVYVITWLGLLYIKRLQMHDADHFKLISDNKQLEQVARIDDVTIHAKVLLVWNAKKL